MRKQIYLLTGVVGLYLLTAFGLHLIYGPSLEFPQHENEWRPDGFGGWVAEGKPASPMPDVPSVNVPILIQYLPIFIPALLLILFMFTPLSRKLDSRARKESEGAASLEAPPEEDGSGSHH